ncbi:MAG: hypothetical protein ACRCX8_00690 [Sarcina sp.]
MQDVYVKLNIKHRESFIKIIDKLDSYIRFKYTMTEKMNGNIAINFIDDIDALIEEFPRDVDFYARLKKLIKAQKIQAPRKIILIFTGEVENEIK